jgi:hypothetical protein
MTADTVVSFGEISGVGSITAAGGVTLNGLLSAGYLSDDPSTEIGQLSFSGDVAFGADSVTEFDIAGTAVGSYDQIVIKGTATFGGSLVLNFIDGFAPDEGDVFSLFIDDFLGTFDSVTILGLADGFLYSLSGNSSGFFLLALNDGISSSAVPAGAPLLLIAAGAALYAARRRRR